MNATALPPKPTRSLLAISFGMVLAGAGLVAGYAVGHRHGHDEAEAEAVDDDHAHEPHAPGEDEDDHHHVVLPPETLANLGVTTAKVHPSTFAPTVEVRAHIVDEPLARRPIHAPTAGIVRALHAAPNQSVPAGAPLVSLWQAPLRRPSLALTGAIVAPVNEELHEVFGTLRSARAEFEIRTAQLERLERSRASAGASEVPAVPAQVVIDARSARVRARHALDNARARLAFHGLSAEEITELENHTEHAEPHSHSLNSATIWRRALRRHGLWTKALDDVLTKLPEAHRSSPWTTALLGELTAAGRLPSGLAARLGEVPALGTAFERTASELLAGVSLERLVDLARVGALEPRYTVLAPATPELAQNFAKVDRWLVTEVTVRVGEHVTAGQPMAQLYDPRSMRLVLEPTGAAIADVRQAQQAGIAFGAEPAIAGSGPPLDGLVLVPTTVDGRPGSAFARCTNQAVPMTDDGKPPTSAFALQPRLRYVAHVPRLHAGRAARAFVLPPTALTEDGADRVVFRIGEEPGDFDPVPVHVLAEDSRQVAVATDGALQPGDEVVLTGAMGLGLAIRAAQGNGPPAHSHDH